MVGAGEALASAGYALIHRFDHRAFYPKAQFCAELVFARARGCVRVDQPPRATDSLVLFDPSRDWLAARAEPCVEPEAAAREPAQRCAPWNNASAPRQTGPTVYVERKKKKMRVAAGG